MRINLQAFCAGEHALDDNLSQCVNDILKLGAVLLEAWRGFGELSTGGILSVVWSDAVESGASRLFTNLNGGIALYKLLTEGGHTDHTTACQ